jgi:hypothetical protein
MLRIAVVFRGRWLLIQNAPRHWMHDDIRDFIDTVAKKTVAASSGVESPPSKDSQPASSSLLSASPFVFSVQPSAVIIDHMSPKR